MARAPSASGRGRVMASVSFTSRMSFRLAGTAAVTRPAPLSAPPPNSGWRPRSCRRSPPPPPGGRRCPCCCRRAWPATAPASRRRRESRWPGPGREPGGMPMSTSHRRPRQVTARRHDLPQLGKPEGHRDPGLDGRAQRLPGVGAQAAGDVHRQHRDAPGSSW